MRNGKIHSRPDCWPSKPAKRCVDKQSGNLVGKPKVCQRSENPERAKQPVLGFQSLDKASGKEVLIRNDGVYVISGIFREQMLAFAEKNTFPSRLLAVEAREAVRRQAIGKFRWQTAGLSTIRKRSAGERSALCICAPARLWGFVLRSGFGRR